MATKTITDLVNAYSHSTWGPCPTPIGTCKLKLLPCGTSHSTSPAPRTATPPTMGHHVPSASTPMTTVAPSCSESMQMCIWTIKYLWPRAWPSTYMVHTKWTQIPVTKKESHAAKTCQATLPNTRDLEGAPCKSLLSVPRHRKDGLMFDVGGL